MWQGQRQQNDAQSASLEAARVRRRQARDAANRWLARFAPLLDENPLLAEDDVRARLDLIDSLRAESAEVERDLAASMEPEDAALLTTLQMAAAQIDALETAFKRRLAHLAPGDPEGEVDLTALRAELAEAAARSEIGEFELSGNAPLKLNISRPNVGAATASGIFSLGWLGFTTVHALFMIGGMFAAFGWPALFLLLFYSIFWSVGIGMGWAALNSMATENLVLDGRELTIERNILGHIQTRRYTLARDSRAEGVVANTSIRSRNAAPGREIMILDAENNEVRFGRGASASLQERNIQQINAYLKARG